MSSLQMANFRFFDHSPLLCPNPSLEKLTSSFWGGNSTFINGKVKCGGSYRRVSRVLAMSSSSLKMNLNEYMVTLEKPLGIRFAISVDGKVFVHSIKRGGNAERSRIIMVGDTLKKVSDSSGGNLTEIKDFGDTEKITEQKSGPCSLILERPVSPFPIQQLYNKSDLDSLFNRGRVPIITWNKNMLASSLRPSSESSGNSGFLMFSSKFSTSQGWKSLDRNGKTNSKLQKNAVTAPFSQLVTIFSEEEGSDDQWAHGSFPLDEYTKALERSKGELYYNHSLGMSYSKITEQIYVGSCIQGESDVEALSNAGITAILNFQSEIEAENWGINSNSINEACQGFNILMINYPIRDSDSFDMRKKLPFCVGLLLRLLKKNHRVYITCTTGFDRAPACVIAYLHWMTDTSLHVAYNFVTGLHSCRPDRPAIASATWDLIAMVEKGKTEGPPTHAVTFVWNGQEGEDVSLVGDFTGNWKEPIKAVHKGGPRFEAEVRLTQGKDVQASIATYVSWVRPLETIALKIEGKLRTSKPPRPYNAGNFTRSVVHIYLVLVQRLQELVGCLHDIYLYKYITSGQWRHSNASPTERDGRGNVNNVIEIGDIASIRPTMQQQKKDANIIKVIERPLTEHERFMLAKAARCIAFSVCPIRLVPK